jgi:hypothetical protein
VTTLQNGVVRGVVDHRLREKNIIHAILKRIEMDVALSKMKLASKIDCTIPLF